LVWGCFNGYEDVKKKRKETLLVAVALGWRWRGVIEEVVVVIIIE
jgi:hypothetical protein